MLMVLKNSYDRCLKEMFGLRRFGIKLGLDTIADILHGLGDLQDGLNCIHVAGTNGKGSVASSLAAILSDCGYKTGLYTSPHLVRFNERIQIDNQPITDDQVVQAYQAVRRVHQGLREPTFFEFSTAMALYEFGRQNVDWAVIETGMGGRLDATNIIAPALSIITNISLEHREYLGSNLSQIAGEKAGIIKPRTPVVTGIRQKSALAVTRKISADRNAPLYCLGKDFRVRRSRSGAFTYHGIENTWHNLHTGLLGNHQVDNAALVLAACEVLNRRRAVISLPHIQKGLLTNQWPGRLEVVAANPTLILDGAHNLMAARNLARFLESNLDGRPVTLVIGILDDKPYAAMLKSLLPAARRVILTRAAIDRALAPEKMAPLAKTLVKSVRVIADVDQAVKYALETTGPQGAICVAGSLYVVGEAKAALDQGLLDKKGTRC
jgi:dihydrofolate synthase/folylpolyglutamate synthase